MANRLFPSSQPPSPLKEGLSGPNAMVYVTKIANRTPDEVTEHLLLKNPGCRPDMVTHDFHTVILTMSMRLGDPSTTRFINGTINVAFPQEITILDYSPRGKGTITSIIENGGDVISLSRSLVFTSSGAQGKKTRAGPGGRPVRDSGWPRGTNYRCIQQKKRVLLRYTRMFFAGIPGNA